MITVPKLILEDAKIILEGAEKKAKEIGVDMDIAVVDDGGDFGPAFGIHVSNRGRFMIFGGGLPIFVDGHIVGGVGCSSGSVEEDRIVAQAGIDALMKHLKKG